LVLAAILLAFGTWLVRPPPVASSSVASVASPALIEPPSRAVAGLTGLEHGPAASDVLWLDVVQELGAEDRAAHRWARIRRDGITAARFDPRNDVVYLGLGVVLTHFANDVEASDAVLSEGTRHNPNNPKLWVQRGYNAYFVRGEPQEASVYWQEAALLPNAPHYLGALAALARYQAGDRDDAIEIAERLFAHAEPGLQKSSLGTVLEELKSERRLEAYDAACRTYHETTGSWPPSPAALRDEGYVEAPAFDLFDYPIHLDIDPARESRPCIARSEGVGPRQFERAEELVGSEAQPP